jgi:hypothetical protein
MKGIVEAFPVGVRRFGNLLDPDSEIWQVMKLEHTLRIEGRAEHTAEVLLLLLRPTV